MLDAIAKALGSGDHEGLLLVAILLALAGPLALIYLVYLLIKRGRNGNGNGNSVATAQGHLFSKPQEDYIDKRVEHKWRNLLHGEVTLMVNRVRGEVSRVEQKQDETSKQLESHLRDAEPAMRELEVLKQTVGTLTTDVREIRRESRGSRDILVAVATKLGVEIPPVE